MNAGYPLIAYRPAHMKVFRGRDMRLTKGPGKASPDGFLTRLARDKRGNTMVLGTAALFPLLGMIGSGLDMARAWTVQARMQQACDAAALAGRRAMTNDKIDKAVQTEVTKFFNFNFPQSMYDTSAFTPAVTRPSAGTVRVSADTSVPTSIMRIFGFDDIAVGVNCHASQQFLNIDIVMVLDTTGSMNDKLASGEKKIDALRNAVMAFYDQLKPVQDTLQANGYRVRYSFVPYSQMVNVGRLVLAAEPNAIRRSAPYARITKIAENGDDYDVWWTSQTIAHDDAWMAKWDGCIEERRTIASVSDKPTTAELSQMRDLNIDLKPASGDTNTQWLPADPDPVSKSLNGYACPTRAERLKAWTRGEMDSYVKSLTPVGATYLDLGMVWGARMISEKGVFSDSPANHNGMRNMKFLIFLTDGDMDPQPIAYTGYGLEILQRRIAGGTASPLVKKALETAYWMDAGLKRRHNARFDLLCQSVRNLPASVWTIKLSDQPMDSHLQNCANVGQSETVATQQQLRDKFIQIGQAITELRLSQ